MRSLRFILGDQLSESLSALDDLDCAQDTVLMAEVHDEATYVRHHPQKLVLVFAAMRHFADTLRARGVRVRYVELEDPDNRGSLCEELRHALADGGYDRVIVTEPGEWRVRERMAQWSARLGVPVEIRADTRFLCSIEEFARWAGTRRQLRMEYFYREMRRRTGWLMQGSEPKGGAWNFDADNRERLPDELQPPAPLRFEPDARTRAVMEMVRRRFPDHFGDLDSFAWAVTRADAMRALQAFVAHRLPQFGAYQDAMRTGEDFLFHSALSPYLNLGLLLPREVCEAALRAFEEGRVPLNAVEGFVRQILGWREYVRGIYWTRMPDYARSNHLVATRALPALYWSGETEMNCLRECIRSTRQHGYAHHIQRLMITGNFALLLGVRPHEVEEWYLRVYVDAFEWVELPNTHGMVLHADGGLLGSKPYAASGAYIDRMSDYCRGCAYRPDVKNGPRACPFNYLYWDFLRRNRGRLAQNPRMAMPYRTLARMPPERLRAIEDDSARFMHRIGLTDPA